MDPLTVSQLNATLDLLNQRCKTLRFLAYSSGSVYRHQAREEWLRTVAEMEALRHEIGSTDVLLTA